MTSENNKRIAKNTLFLYFRMLLTMLVSLFTVRVVLNTLGVIDYGIYNVVGGVVVMFSFLSNTMASASQRFFAYELGREDYLQLKKTFNITLIIYFVMAFLILIVAETIGLWFLNTKMIIPASRIYAANWIFQLSLLSFILTILTIPYNAVIIARENMNVFAYISILEVILKLVIVYLLVMFSYDKLILYSILMFFTTSIVTLLYFLYCKTKYPETKFMFFWDNKLAKTLVSYSGWNLFGTLSGMASDQGMNIILNLFFGPAINAARAIAFRVNAAISSFSQNFYVAINPQIIKSYATGDKEYMIKLVFLSSKLAFFLLLLLSLPVFFEMEYILKIWLKQTDYYMIIFTRLVIVFSLIVSLENPLTQAARSTGDIKKYQIYVGVITLMALPISYLFLKYGFPPQTTMYTLIAIYIFANISRLWVLKKLIDFPVNSYIKQVLLRVVIVSCISFFLPLILYLYLDSGLFRFIIISFVSAISVLITSYFLGLKKSEKTLVNTFLNNQLKKFNNKFFSLFFKLKIR